MNRFEEIIQILKTPEYLREQRKSGRREYRRKWYQIHLMREHERSAEWYRMNSENAKARAVAWQKRNLVKKRTSDARYYSKHRLELAKRRLELADEYIKSTISHRTGIKFRDIGIAIIEAKRKSLILGRMLKKLKEAV